MTQEQGLIQVVVRSHEVPARTTQIKTMHLGPGGAVVPVFTTAVIYDRVLDPKQISILEGARSLSRATGAELEVVDIGAKNILGRFLWSLSSQNGGYIKLSDSAAFASNPAVRAPSDQKV